MPVLPCGQTNSYCRIIDRKPRMISSHLRPFSFAHNKWPNYAFSSFSLYFTDWCIEASASISPAGSLFFGALILINFGFVQCKKTRFDSEICRSSTGKILSDSSNDLTFRSLTHRYMEWCTKPTPGEDNTPPKCCLLCSGALWPCLLMRCCSQSLLLITNWTLMDCWEGLFLLFGARGQGDSCFSSSLFFF